MNERNAGAYPRPPSRYIRMRIRPAPDRTPEEGKRNEEGEDIQ